MKNKKILFLIFLLAVCLFSADFAFAREFEVAWPEIPGTEFVDAPGETCEGGCPPEDLEDFIAYVFSFSLMIVGVIALFAFILAAVQYMTSAVAGNKNEAKEKIKNAIIGIVLLFASYIILNTINPDLVNFGATGKLETSFPGAITVYENTTCSGDSENLTGSYPDLSEIGWNNKISSIKIPAGKNVILRICKDKKFKGDCYLFTFDAASPCINNFPDGTTAISDISSLDAIQNAENVGAIIFKDEGFAGESRMFSEGSYSKKDLGKMEDEASSLFISSGYTAILCKHPRGDCFAFMGDYPPPAATFTHFDGSGGGGRVDYLSSPTTDWGHFDTTDPSPCAPSCDPSPSPCPPLPAPAFAPLHKATADIEDEVSKIFVIKKDSESCGVMFYDNCCPHNYADNADFYMIDEGRILLKDSASTTIGNDDIDSFWPIGEGCSVRLDIDHGNPDCGSDEACCKPENYSSDRLSDGYCEPAVNPDNATCVTVE